MITFYEGLPRSGKSYTAIRDFIVPCLQKGRTVFAYIEGLNHEKIAEVAGIGVERCKELLNPLTREQAKDVHRFVTNNAMVILDEVQNFWPTGRQKLDPEITQFITEHGHRGLDLLLMGQSIKDVHALWRRRVERKHYFLKKSALGKPDEYSCSIFTAVPRGDDVAFEVVQTLSYKYEEKYFGTYASHTIDTSNTATMVDERAVIWNRPLFKKWLPIAGVLALACVGYVIYLFNGGFEKSLIKKKTPEPVAAVSVAPPLPVGAIPIPDHPVSLGDKRTISAPVEPVAPMDVIEELNSRGRIRLMGSLRVGSNTRGFIEWRDAANNLLQIFTFHEISGLGWSIMVNLEGTVATLTKGPSRINATAWVIDRSVGRTSETQQREVSGKSSPLSLAYQETPQAQGR